MAAIPAYIDIHTHNPATDMADSIRHINLHEHFDQLSPTGRYSIGLHPWYLADIALQFAELKEHAGASVVKAVGECGLDYICSTSRPVQIEAFKMQIELAGRLAKPLIIHCVQAYNDVLHMLQKANTPAIFHGFNRKATLAAAILGKGHYLSFGAGLLHKEHIREVIRQTPADRFFLETDDVAIPIDILYKETARIRKTREDVIILQLQKNYENIFN